MLKYKLFILFVFIFGLLSVNVVYANTKKNNLPLLGKVIYVDPGHGGT